MSTKSQNDVGKDFDKYAKEWAEQAYGLEVKPADGKLLGRETSEEVRVPGDEWGRQTDLENLYRAFFNKYAPGQFSLLEIGSGGGRLTEVIARNYAHQIHDYHTLDASSEMTNVLKKRIENTGITFTHHVGGSANLDELPQDYFSFIFSQSCWSHVSLYDQYLYLRDLRKVIAVEGILMVNGVFLLGGNNDWGWNRFRRRVSQKEQNSSGVYHEFTGTHATIEMALRLGWEVIAITNQAFIMRFRHAKKDIMFDKWADVPSHRKEAVFASNLMAFLDKGQGKKRSVDFIQV